MAKMARTGKTGLRPLHGPRPLMATVMQLGLPAKHSAELKQELSASMDLHLFQTPGLERGHPRAVHMCTASLSCLSTGMVCIHSTGRQGIVKHVCNDAASCHVYCLQQKSTNAVPTCLIRPFSHQIHSHSSVDKSCINDSVKFLQKGLQDP